MITPQVACAVYSAPSATHLSAVFGTALKSSNPLFFTFKSLLPKWSSVTKLIYSHPRAIVFQGRWQDVGLTDKSVDVILTDPPYDPHTHSNVRSCSTNGPVKVLKYDIDFAPLTDMSHVPEFLRIARRWVLCFSSLEMIGDYMRAAGGHYKTGGGYVRGGIWRKKQATPQLSGDRPANSCEAWCLMHPHPKRGKLEWQGRGTHAYLTSAVGDEQVPAYCAEDRDCGAELEAELVADLGEQIPSFVEFGREREKKRHPAQKPKELCERLAKWFVPRRGVPIANQVVLDPYAGSGALGLAALKLGATVIFCEIDARWCEHIAGECEYFLTQPARPTLPQLVASP